MAENQELKFNFENYRKNFEFPEKLAETFLENLEFYNMQQEIMMVNFKKSNAIKKTSLKFIQPDLLVMKFQIQNAGEMYDGYWPSVFKMRLFVMNHKTMKYEIKLNNSHKGRRDQTVSNVMYNVQKRVLYAAESHWDKNASRRVESLDHIQWRIVNLD